MTQRVTNAELNERASKRAENQYYWRLCQKCGEDEWTHQQCKCPACRTEKISEKRMFIHIGQMNPATIDWASYDLETDSYISGISDGWNLCERCSRKYQVYANW